MADKVDKGKKKAKPKKDERGVLAALPSTRPDRIGGRRDTTTAPATTPAAATPSASASTATTRAAAASSSTASEPARAKPKRSAATRATPKRSAATRSSRATPKRSAAKRSSRPTAGRRKAAAPRTFEPTEAAEAAAGAVPRAETPPKPARERTYPRPQPVREGAPGIGTGGYRDEPSSESGRPSGVELAGTAVRAAGEVAQLGLTIGGEVLKRVVRRLPRP
jgi:hypothetical protein